MMTKLEAREARTVARAMHILEKSILGESADPLSSPKAATNFLRLRIGLLEHEEFHAIWLTSQNRVIAVESLFRGTLTHISVYPREVLKSALRHNAASVIFAHNHPGGSTKPSQADISLTQALRDALAVIDVRLSDHIIVTATGAASLMDLGLMPKSGCSHE